MSQHNQYNWSDFLLCIGMELAFHKNGERPIQEQMIAEKLMKLNALNERESWIAEDFIFDEDDFLVPK